MKYLLRNPIQGMAARRILLTLYLLATIASSSHLHADQGDVKVIEVKLGGYRFIPQDIHLIAEQPAVLRLVNTDSITPHNFTMKALNGTADIDVDILGGESVNVQLSPLPAGRYTFYCGNKLIFMKSHREKGMEGRLIVSPE
jgi:plastocyanin